ncbi:MAG: DUF222 domain-containing protein [Nocardioides sp.]
MSTAVDATFDNAVLDLHPDATHPVTLALGVVHQALDGLLGELPAMASGDYRAAVVEVERAIRRLDAVKLRLVAAADAVDVSRDAGLPDTTAWLAKNTHATGAAASRQVALAQDLETLPATRSAMDTGAVSVEHARVIARTHGQLPTSLSDEQIVAVEEKLLAWAHDTDPAGLRRKSRQVLHDITTTVEAEAHHADVLMDEERAALAKTRLTLHDNHDGTITGHFTVPTLAGDILKKILQQLTAPRRAGASDAQGGPLAPKHDHAHQRGLAFLELLEHLPTDRLHGKVAATIVITMQHKQLVQDLAAAGVDTGHETSPGDARRIACNAGILPAILNGQSLPLDLGRSKRLFTEAQRTALATRHATCAAHGCDRPYAWCELHHADPWAHVGTTDLAKAIPLCGWHHRRIHDPAYQHDRLPDGTLRFHRRT